VVTGDGLILEKQRSQHRSDGYIRPSRCRQGRRGPKGNKGRGVGTSGEKGTATAQGRGRVMAEATNGDRRAPPQLIKRATAPARPVLGRGRLFTHCVNPEASRRESDQARPVRGGACGRGCAAGDQAWAVSREGLELAAAGPLECLTGASGGPSGVLQRLRRW
jgi:hypothetical protein